MAEPKVSLLTTRDGLKALVFNTGWVTGRLTEEKARFYGWRLQWYLTRPTSASKPRKTSPGTCCCELKGSEAIHGRPLPCLDREQIIPACRVGGRLPVAAHGPGALARHARAGQEQSVPAHAPIQHVHRRHERLLLGAVGCLRFKQAQLCGALGDQSGQGAAGFDVGRPKKKRWFPPRKIPRGADPDYAKCMSDCLNDWATGGAGRDPGSMATLALCISNCELGRKVAKCDGMPSMPVA